MPAMSQSSSPSPEERAPAASGQFEQHAQHYDRARKLIEVLTDDEERSILKATMQIITLPRSS